MSEVRIDHPNREKAESKATKAIVILLLLVSAGLIALITAAGWSELQGAKPVAVGYVIVYLVMAYYVVQWNRGVLPVAAALAVLFAVVAAVAAPAWFDRDKAGFDAPEFVLLNEQVLDAAILGLLTVITVIVQLLLLAFAMRGFTQKWNVEVEVSSDHPGGYEPPDGSEPQPAGA